MALTDTTFVFNPYQFIRIFENHPVIILYMTDYFGTITEILVNLAGWAEVVLSSVIQGV